MKIALFTDTFYPQLNGVAASVLTLQNNLAALGHQVYVVTTTDPEAPPGETTVVRLPSLPVPHLRERRIGMFYHPRLARLIRSWELDLIHTHTEFCLGSFGRYLARDLQIPLLHSMHTIYEDYTHYLAKLAKLRMLSGLAKAAARKISADFCNSADHVIVPTDKVRDLMRSYGVWREIATVPSGILVEKFAGGQEDPSDREALRADLGIKAGERVLLYIGRLAEEKNLTELLRDLATYLTAQDNIRLLLIGDGPDRGRLEDLAASLGIGSRAIFAGARPWDEIERYYRLGDVFVNTSQSESQGLTYIEAMAAGLPVVAKADRCLDGVLEDGKNGYAFQDQAGMLTALDLILGDDAARELLAQRARQTARRFSAAGYGERVAELYQAVLAAGKGYQAAKRYQKVS
ncbi:MAG: glycosyltransferase family 4 protein [Peptococcaceae bacterium]|jgi:1,2-diacylglycerol 3-alpha-glucosyltransferase|nr:glycosyltransferase family 4 protein [Peptococcaceae bacterium]